MSETKDNRRVALETAHTFGHRDHKNLLKTAMDIESYLEHGVRPAIDGESVKLTATFTNDMVRDLVAVYGFDPAELLASHLKKLEKTVEFREEGFAFDFRVEADKTIDGNYDIQLVGTKRPLTYSKKQVKKS